MKLIRKSVFETNSSSTHSISVGNSDVFDGITPDYTNKIELEPMEFGWGEEHFQDVESRLAYVYLYIRDWTGQVEKIMFKEMFDQVVKAHTGADEITMISRGEYDRGYIDHQSVEDANLHFLFSDPATLKSFLFDSSSWVKTDNDNH